MTAQKTNDKHSDAGKTIATTPYDAKLEPLFGFIRAGDCHRCREWIEAGKPLLNPASREPSPLVAAASTGFFSILETMLDGGDWEEYPAELEAALGKALETRNPSNVLLLLDRGASPNSLPWQSIFEAHAPEITRAFLQHGKSTEGLYPGWDHLERESAAVLAEFLPMREDLHQEVLQQMIRSLDDAEDFGKRAKRAAARGSSFANVLENFAKRERRCFRLLAATGPDIHRPIEHPEGGTTTLLEHTVRHGDFGQLLLLSPTKADHPAIVAAAKELPLCGEAKTKYLFQCGLPVNDREDGTSSVMARALLDGQFGVFVAAASLGGKLPDLSPNAWRRFRESLHRPDFPPYRLPLLARHVTEARMAYLLDHEGCKEKFGRSALQIVEDLYHPETALSPDRFAALMQAERQAHAGRKYCRAVQSFRTIVRKANRATRKQGPEYVVPSVACSREIEPWLFNFLDEFASACVEIGGTCHVRKDPLPPPGDRMEATFCVTFLGIEFDMAIRELWTAPALYWYKRSPDGKVPAGRLEITCDACASYHPLAKETDFLGFKDQSPALAVKLLKMAKRRKQAAEREAARARKEAVRRKEEAAEAERQAKERAAEEKRQAAERRVAWRRTQLELAMQEAARKRRESDARLFDRLLEKAEILDQCRRAARYLDDWEVHGARSDPPSPTDAAFLARLRKIVADKEAQAWILMDSNATKEPAEEGDRESEESSFWRDGLSLLPAPRFPHSSGQSPQ